MSDRLLTVVIPVITLGMIIKCLDTLYKYTDTYMFRVIIIDQTILGIDNNLRDKYMNLMIIRSPKTERFYTGNIGFQLASNIGIKLADTPYVMLLNDDVELISAAWWQGVMETFEKIKKATPQRPALLVNLASIKLPDWSVGLPKGEHHYILPYKEDYTTEDWDFLVNQPHYVNEHLTITVGSVVDGINLYASVIDREKLLEIGLLDELLYPGSAGDYDLGCIASMRGYRCVSTTLSWVYHHWSITFAAISEEDDVRQLAIPEIHVTDLRQKWGDRFDLWGVACETCKEILHSDDGITAVCPNGHETYQMPQNTQTPL